MVRTCHGTGWSAQACASRGHTTLVVHDVLSAGRQRARQQCRQRRPQLVPQPRRLHWRPPHSWRPCWPPSLPHPDCAVA